MRLGILASVALHVIVVATACAWSLRSEAPEPWVLSFAPAQLCASWAQDEGNLLIGARPAEVLAFFGEPQSAPTGAGCWRYQFTNDLSLTLLFDRGTVTQRWVARATGLPAACGGRLEHRFQLRRAFRALGFPVECPGTQLRILL
jgi:hypothetical protein